MTARIRFFGAAGCVTGSCTLLEVGDTKVLIDCGLFQGPKTLKALNYGPFPFDVKSVDAVLLTHAHVDHSGLLPKLALAGFGRPIFATHGTIELCRIMLPDAGAIQEVEVEALNRRNQRRGEKAVAPIFTKADAERCMQLFQAVAFGVWFDVARNVRVRWWNAGHILGAASIEVEINDGEDKQTVLFSGDVGPGGRDFFADPEGPTCVDHIVLESTYGDVIRPPLTPEARKQALAAEVRAAHAAGGPLLIPAFAVERTQELIVDLLELMERNEAPPGPIFLDSPLAVRASQIFLRASRHDDARFDRLKESAWLRFTEQISESRALERMHGWHVIIAASGMCDAGRVRHHLKRLLWRPEASVLLVGYQAIGTLGRLLQEGRRVVRIQGEEIKVRANVRMLDVYSGHADAEGLLKWAQARQPVKGGVFLTHGEPDNLDGLRSRLINSGMPEGQVIVARLDQSYRLKAARPAEADPPAPSRIPPEASARLDWHNKRAELMSRLRALLDGAHDDATREAILTDLNSRLDAFDRADSAGEWQAS